MHQLMTKFKHKGCWSIRITGILKENIHTSKIINCISNKKNRTKFNSSKMFMEEIFCQKYLEVLIV